MGLEDGGNEELLTVLHMGLCGVGEPMETMEGFERSVAL